MIVHHSIFSPSVPADSIETSVTSVGPPVAGYNYSLVCTLTLREGLLGTPTIWWVGRDGQPITSGGDVVVHDPVTSGLTTNLTLFFDPIRTRDEGTYTCMASLSSPALNATILNSSTSTFIDVQLSKYYKLFSSYCINSFLICNLQLIP